MNESLTIPWILLIWEKKFTLYFTFNKNWMISFILFTVNMTGDNFIDVENNYFGKYIMLVKFF